MEIDSCIKDRRSIRSYLDKDVPLELILELINSAHFAPSSGNIQNWRFIIIKNKETKRKIAESCLDQLWMTQAPVFIVICSDREQIQSLYETHKNTYSIQNSTLSAQNIMLKAHSLKLGTCFIGGFSKIAMKRILNIPETAEPEIVLTLGYPNENPKSKRCHFENFTFFEAYGNKRTDKSLWPIEKHVKKLFSKFKKK